MVLGTILAIVAIILAVMEVRRSTVTVGRNELVVMTRTSRQGEEQYTLKEGKHVRFRLMGHRPVMRLDAARHDVSIGVNVGPELTTVRATATLAGIGYGLNPNDAIELYAHLRPQRLSESQNDSPTVVASRQLNRTEAPLKSALCEVMAKADYDGVHALKSDSRSLMTAIMAIVEKAFDELGFRLVAFEITSIDPGSVRRELIDHALHAEHRRNQEVLDAAHQRAQEAHDLEHAAQIAEDKFVFDQAELRRKKELQQLSDGHKLAAAQRARQQAELFTQAYDIQTQPVRNTLAALAAAGVGPSATQHVITTLVSCITQPVNDIDTEPPTERPEAKTQQMKVIDPASLPGKGTNE